MEDFNNKEEEDDDNWNNPLNDAESQEKTSNMKFPSNYSNEMLNDNSALNIKLPIKNDATCTASSNGNIENILIIK